MHYSGNMDLTFLFEDLQVQSSVGKDFLLNFSAEILACSAAFFFQIWSFHTPDFTCRLYLQIYHRFVAEKSATCAPTLTLLCKPFFFCVENAKKSPQKQVSKKQGSKT